MHRELADDGFARAGGGTDKHPVTDLQRLACPDLERIELKIDTIDEVCELGIPAPVPRCGEGLRWGLRIGHAYQVATVVPGHSATRWSVPWELFGAYTPAGGVPESDSLVDLPDRDRCSGHRCRRTRLRHLAVIVDWEAGSAASQDRPACRLIPGSG